MKSFFSRFAVSGLVLNSIFGIVLAISLLSGAARANADDEVMLPAYLAPQEVAFDYQGRFQSYHCDFVRAETTAVLRKLGAIEIEVFCDGGLPYERGNHVEANFIALRQTTEDKSTRLATVTPVEFNFTTSCDLRDTVITAVLEGFDVMGLTKAGTCRNSRGTLKFNFATLF